MQVLKPKTSGLQECHDKVKIIDNELLIYKSHAVDLTDEDAIASAIYDAPDIFIYLPDSVKTERICRQAVYGDFGLFKHIKNPSHKFIKEILQKEGLIIKYVENQTEEMCLIAIQNNPFSLQYIKHQTDELCLSAVLLNGHAVEYVKNPTIKIIMAALRQNVTTSYFLENPTEDMIATAKINDGKTWYSHTNSFVMGHQTKADDQLTVMVDPEKRIDVDKILYDPDSTTETFELLGISTRVWRQLKYNGINSIDDLTKFTEDDLFKLPNIGTKSLSHIIRKLSNFGLTLKE